MLDSSGSEPSRLELAAGAACVVFIGGFIGLPYLVTGGESVGAWYETAGLLLFAASMLVIGGVGAASHVARRRAHRAYRGHDDL